jgi:hypothetical protein
MSELQNKTVTMELNNLQLETIKYLFGHKHEIFTLLLGQFRDYNIFSELSTCINKQ